MPARRRRLMILHFYTYRLLEWTRRCVQVIGTKRCAMAIVDVADEMASVSLGDKRRNRRATEIARRLQTQPAASFPSLFGEAALEGFYRFTNNESVTPTALLEPHRRASWGRAQGAGGLRLVVHDSTEFTFPGEKVRRGLPRSGGESTYQCHLSLLVEYVEAPVVLGVVGMRNYLLEAGVWSEAAEDGTLRQLACGSERWRDAVTATREEAPRDAPLVHVMDREADDYPLLCVVIAGGDDLVVRSYQNRNITGDIPHLKQALQRAPTLVERDVWLSRRTGLRPPAALKKHPTRDTRPARLSIRSGSVRVKRSGGADKALPDGLDLNLVEVFELDPPEGEEPVHWRLLTTLPVETAADAEHVVDIYRKRWLIEEYFRALKTGCAIDTRQAESREALFNTVALLAPVAVRLLQLRALARHSPSKPAVGLLDGVELASLRRLAPKPELPPQPTYEQLLGAIALLGGHLKSNGTPGWIVLGRGFERLQRFADGWRAALRASTDGGLEM